MSRRYVIIGNGIAGQTCAEELRKRDADCSIVMLTQEPHPLYNRVALPRFLKGQLRQEKVMLRTVQDYQAQRIDIRFGTTALILDPAAREIVASDGSRFVYDAVLLATGGRPRQLEAPGIDMIKNVHTFYTLDDARSIAEAADRAERVLVLGGSFIAYELADAYCAQARVRVEEYFDQLWRNTDDGDRALTARVLAGDYEWLEAGVLDQSEGTGPWIADASPRESRAENLHRSYR